MLKQAADLHASAALSAETKTATYYYWPFSGSCMCCVFLAEKTLQRMSVCGCEIVFGLSIGHGVGKIAENLLGRFHRFLAKALLLPPVYFLVQLGQEWVAQQ